MIRLVATDVDGTLLHGDGTISARTRVALRAATTAGLRVAFVSGRPPRWLDELVAETGHLELAVGANGAVLYDAAAERVLVARQLEPALLRELGATLRASFPSVQFAVERGMAFAAEPGYIHDWAISPPYDRRGRPIEPPALGELDEITAEPAVKLLAKVHDVDADTFLAAARQVVGERATLTHSSSAGLLEIAAPGVTKATGLAELAARYGIAREEVAAIGDMPNDVPMLAWAGRSYAVGNAHPAARAAAGAVTVTNDEDAVAMLIEGLL